MLTSRLIVDNVETTNLSISFQNEKDGITEKFTRSLVNIRETASYDDICSAGRAISKLYEHTKYEIKLITTNLIMDDSEEEILDENAQVQTLEEIDETQQEETETLEETEILIEDEEVEKAFDENSGYSLQ